MHMFKIRAIGGSAVVELDGGRLEGVQSVTFSLAVPERIPLVTITLRAEVNAAAELGERDLAMKAPQ